MSLATILTSGLISPISLNKAKPSNAPKGMISYDNHSAASRDISSIYLAHLITKVEMI